MTNRFRINYFYRKKEAQLGRAIKEIDFLQAGYTECRCDQRQGHENFDLAGLVSKSNHVDCENKFKLDLKRNTRDSPSIPACKSNRILVNLLHVEDKEMDAPRCSRQQTDRCKAATKLLVEDSPTSIGLSRNLHLRIRRMYAADIDSPSSAIREGRKNQQTTRAKKINHCEAIAVPSQ
jgi:hypothetical protein